MEEFNMRNEDDRYQNKHWLIKLWRRRHMLKIPFRVIEMYANSPSDYSTSLGQYISIALGQTHMDMEWWYTSEEVFGRMHVALRKRLEGRFLYQKEWGVMVHVITNQPEDLDEMIMVEKPLGERRWCKMSELKYGEG